MCISSISILEFLTFSLTKKKGDIKLEGNIGNLNFHKTDDQYRVRQKVGKKNKNEINNIAERSKENASEFGHAASFAKEIRSALKVTMKDHYELFYEPSHITRLNKRLHLILKADEENERGKRLVSPVNLKLLKNFSLNIHSPFKDVFLSPIEIN
ncbi:hypothetical protein FAZ15_05025 [Sphingobacterium olei]|uniref:Uncharacterized protein n=1 Tax=Sphingobacterium olei TaxID=2571155 RepID=A0A4U0PGI4_9SPHI|nr:hypothetical protein [Sphingobacterium olei]TJZ61884.1 hypothetical protein FAZ15_05025 [Sphingobacterium olei]